MTDNWSTPQDLFDELNEEFNFDLDVCASDWNHKTDRYFTENDDALSRDWDCNCFWMNPPYSDRNLEKWIRYADILVKKSATNGLFSINRTGVALVPARIETKYFHECVFNNEIRFIQGRVHFTDENGKSGRPRFGSMLVIFRKEENRSVGPSPKYRGGN